ncbi:hypothetical protein [Parasitella parasitica]|uniref:FCP1 homology domain-containing protein n=1 Tax=Parasitella parasitica TaxID=35722 RepID=A0A0B7NE27_9FUNG|nr:hypothetical protein [Parasitella parasitica]
MVWSSARKQSVQMMCKIFQHPLELVWNRDHFELEPDQYYRKAETIKDLTKVWHHFSNLYDAKNTVVLDDTDSKLVYQPYNLIHIETFDFNNIFQGGTDHELLKVIRYLEVLRSQSNVANFIHNSPFNSNNFEIAVNWKLDTAMAHYSRKGTMLRIFEHPEKHKRKLTRDDCDMEENKTAKKKKRIKSKKSASTCANNDDATTIPLRPETKNKLKSIVQEIKKKKSTK